MPRSTREKSTKDRPTIGEHLQTCENKGKFKLPLEAKIAWFMLVAIASAKFFLNL